MDSQTLLLLIVGALVGGAAGYLGSFMVMKRMALVGDALSHVALPGMAIASTIGVNPMLGAFVALTTAVVGIWHLSKRTEIYPETLVGVFFTASLAIGVLITPEPELFENLFGSIEKINLGGGLITAILAIIIFLATRKIAKQLLLGVVSEELASVTGVNIQKINFIYLFLVGLTVALGVTFVGTLLTGALVIVPAAAAKNIGRTSAGFQFGAAILGSLSAILGILVSTIFHLPPGPSVVLVSILFFLASYIFRKKG